MQTPAMHSDREDDIPERATGADAIDDLDVEARERHDCQDQLWEGELESDVFEEGGVACCDGVLLGWGVDACQDSVGRKGDRQRCGGQEGEHGRCEQEERDVAWRPVGEEADVPVVFLNPGVDAWECASAPWTGVGGCAEFGVGDCLREGEGKGYEGACDDDAEEVEEVDCFTGYQEGAEGDEGVDEEDCAVEEAVAAGQG